ncbi:MAG: sensor histidine kinase, partial [Chitinophagia bacterium]|nr:sensor histidine kinase [Chitinophagia bacterium]
SFLVSFAVVRFFLERFIFRRIKLVYKVISESKDSLKDAPGLNSTNTTLEDVNDKVTEWAEAAEEEISYLKSLEDYRKKFVGDISHELKTPIFSIQGYLHTLLDGGLYDESINRKYIERAASNVERLQMIVEDLEMINKLESESEELYIVEFDLKELVSEVFRDLEIIANEKAIKLLFKPGADKPFMVEADREKIRQVLVNLIINSIKYGKEGGITKVSFYDMDELVLTEVSDNGVGIIEEHLKHVFDRFYRADKSRSRNVGGSGLGLSIVKHIMEAHKQKITVRSTSGLGSTFSFTLKLVD